MLDVDDQAFHVLVMKVAYSLQNGQCVIDESHYPALCEQDEFSGEVNRSSIRYESDFAPYKPLCDVIVNAVAYAPGVVPVRSFPVNLTIMDGHGQTLLDKSLLIQGEKSYRYQASKVEESEITPFVTLPIDYRYAFGGENKIYAKSPAAAALREEDKLSDAALAAHPEEQSPLAHTAFEDNVIGTGFAERWYVEAIKEGVSFAAPRILDPAHPFTLDSFANQLKRPRNTPDYVPAGFGFVSRAAKTRRALAGTYDEAWLTHRSPYLPKDFDFAYWNGAPTGQQIPYPPNHMRIALKNLSPTGTWEIELPAHRAFILLRMNNGLFIPVMLNIDTVVIEPERNHVLLTHRVQLPTTLDIRVIEARFEVDPQAPLMKL
ncbi:hypothetical protein AAEX37_01173 [Oligella sp. MSHR50489EDL]|uniref:DUF2169 family type VI secretion system accessory protein n=1 Tax=Oligella sp. MSHR50489EDL TaxID=3139409 RepID=UPI003D81B985